MIKNIIFDVGMVLVHFSWEKTFRDLGLAGDVFEAVADATVRSDMWNEYDRSTLHDDEILAGFIQNAPTYEAEIRLVWEHVGDMVSCYPYTKNWIKELKANGYKCFVLSNYPKRTYELTKRELDFVEDMDGGIFSYEVQFVKPEKEIYQALIDKYGLNPGECVFLDDNKNNVDAAVSYGIHGIWFQTREQAEMELSSLDFRCHPI